MKIFELQYSGTGTEKQIKYAKSIFDKELDALKRDYDYAKDRTSRQNMPQDWLDSWNEVIQDERMITAWTCFAAMPAGKLIELKGYPTKRGTVKLSRIADRLAKETYEKKRSIHKKGEIK